MNLKKRIDLLIRLGGYMLSDDEKWNNAKKDAERANAWFNSEFIDLSAQTIATRFLDPVQLEKFADTYRVPQLNANAKKIGLVMAGNIPLVGFHDWLCTFLSGHAMTIKTSSKDDILISHLVAQLGEWEPALHKEITFAPMLKGCDAYIATGSTNSSRYFTYYFSRYPNIIRRNRTSAAILTGNEVPAELEKLSDDINLYYGLGCRNVTKVYVPREYDFVPLLTAFNKYAYFIDHHKYKNNYDYQLAIHLINRKYYMTNGTVLMSEDKSLFSPISQLNYEYYTEKEQLELSLHRNEDIQCIVGVNHVPFGKSQCPDLTDFADGVDTMKFLLSL